jgi:centrosomal protein POC5
MITRRDSAVRISQMTLPEDQDEISHADPNSQTMKTEDLQLSAHTDSSPARPYAHHPVVLDLDMQNYTTRLDTLISNFRNESMKEFLGMKTSILREQEQIIAAEKKKFENSLQAKQEEIDTLASQLKAANSDKQKYDLQINHLAILTGTIRAKHKITKLHALTFSAWFKYHKHCILKKRLTDIAAKHAKQSAVRRVFTAWRYKWQEISDKKRTEAFKHQLESEKNELALQLNKEIQLLRDRLEETKDALAREHEAKVSIQENLKKAFMRGVCAMNFEAMNIFQSPSNLVDSSALAAPLDMSSLAFSGAGSPHKPEQQYVPSEATEETQETAITLDDIQNRIPAESKDHRWKPAVVYGRPGTAPAPPVPFRENDTIESSIPSNLNTVQTEGKTIFANKTASTPVIKGKVPAAKKLEVKKPVIPTKKK